jgi:MoxR-like ATPase
VSETTAPSGSDLEQLQSLERAYGALQGEIGKVIIGQRDVVEQLLVALFSGGNCLLVGVPGLAKTLLISTLASILSLRFARIQFTPDLMPSDITGTEILEEDIGTGKRVFKFVRGPIFANVVLADEINRTPPKTQAALLQAMQEHEVTAGGTTHALELPFFVLATQNPIEQEGTYPLPEAQLDRFMFNIKVGYPSIEEEVQIVEVTTRPAQRRSASGARRQSDLALPRSRPARSGREARHRVRGAIGTRHAPRGAGWPRHSRVRRLGRRTARRTALGARCESARGAATAGRRRGSRTSKPWRTTCCGIASSRTSTPKPKASTPTS